MVGAWLGRVHLNVILRTWGIELELWKRLCCLPGVSNLNLYRNFGWSYRSILRYMDINYWLKSKFPK
ncbi:hypothetical protein HZ326_15508 [Fusarium oxysporum f. sp. albedinis]|nr:hypothetical protein HZ326_15508 [Fusarium oxysporum f. sp. albedinis]